MALSLIDLLTTTENLLIKNNTNTSSYDISEGLNKRVVNFYKGSSGLFNKIPIPKSLYPACCIELIKKPEEFAQLGRTAKRNVEIRMDIITITNYEASSNEGESLENSQLENIRLSQNIESLIRNKVDLSTTAIHTALISDVDYSIDTDNIYNNVSRISLNLKAYTT